MVDTGVVDAFEPFPITLPYCRKEVFLLAKRLNASVEWRGQSTFVGTVPSGAGFTLQAGGEVQGAGGEPMGSVTVEEPAGGVGPKEAVLIGLGGCTGIDVVSILDKMRQPLRGLAIEMEAEQREEHPRVFTQIQMRYRVRGEGLDPDQVKRAITLSQDKYCGVLAMLAQTAEVAYAIELNGETVATGERLAV